MSTFPPQYPYQPQQFFYEQSAYDLAHNDVRRAKTPTDSLVNHTGLSPGGHSPGPLITTPPPLSRNHSQQPIPSTEQLPEQSFYENGSFSNSPTSVRTPDNDSFEVEMLDSDIGRFYQQDPNMMSTQGPQNNISAVDSAMYLSDQGRLYARTNIMYADRHSNTRSTEHDNGSTTIPATAQHGTATEHDGCPTSKYVFQRELPNCSATTHPHPAARTMEWSGPLEIRADPSTWACYV